MTAHDPRYRARAACLLLMCLLHAASQAQYWVRKAASPGNEYITDVQVDADGAVYVTGSYGGTLQFGGQSLGNQGGLDLFVARLDAAGVLQWIVQGGGPGIDRGIKLSVGTGGTIAVAGEFMGSANLFGTALTSAGGTADGFVAVLNKDDGTLQWIRQGGGADGADGPGGVSMGGDGRVTVAGQFRGTAQWEGNTLVSTIDPLTLLPSADIFIATYTATGSLLWLKHGAADKDDLAVDVVHDAAGNLYVAGQYSNAITFDQTYPNILANAGFLLRLAPDGSETWFRRMGGAVYNHVRDLAFTSGALLVVGDQQGTMVWTGTTTVNISSPQPFAYHLLKVASDGALLAHATVGSSSGVASAAVAVLGGNVAVYGTFDCQFSDLTAHYASDALFMATGNEDLFVAVHGLGDLALQEAQQFGGRSAKAAGGLAWLPAGELVFSGAFQENIIFPSSGFMSGEAVPFNQGSGTTGVVDWCTYANYGSFHGCVSAGLVDGFVARAYVPGRAPYDWWKRTSGVCDRVRNEPCIPDGSTCGDTVVACGQVNLGVDPRMATATTGSQFVGPALNYLWSTGSTSPTLVVNTSGTYWVQLSTTNGCWQWTDSIEVVINPMPPITWLSIGGDPPDTPPFGLIQLCEPDSTWLVASNLPINGTWWWQLPNGTEPVYGDSIGVDTNGTFIFHVVNEFGCERVTYIAAQDDPVLPMPDIDAVIDVQFPQLTSPQDTLWLCAGDMVAYSYIPAWTIDGLPVDTFPSGLNVRWCLEPCSWGTVTDPVPQTFNVTATQSGWMVFDVQVTVDNLPCAEDTLFFHGLDSLYVGVFPPLNVDVQLTGPATICDGDTVLLSATCAGCDNLTWWTTGTGAPVNSNTYMVWSPGQYGINGTAADTNGCTAVDQASMLITAPSGPVLTITPPDGIICPGDSAVITTLTAGADPIWFGPQGIITGQGTSLTTAQPGSYSLNLTVEGCPVTSNSVTITSYGTPFLAGGGQLALCFPGDEVTIEVMTVPGAVVQWQAPLSGSALTQAVYVPGTYTCSVTACGIVTPLSIEVVQAPVQAQLLTPGPFTLCPGDTLELQAGTGAATYTWLPGLWPGPQLEVAQAGTYRVVVTNSEGCTDTSALITVGAIAFNVPLSATGDTVCAGDAAVLTASGSGAILWYASSGTGTPLGGGSPFSFTPTSGTTVYVRQQVASCLSPADSVWVEVLPRPPAVWTTGPDSLCTGDALLISINGPDTVGYHWTTPGGAVQGATVSIPAVTVADMGNYVCTPVYGACHGVPSSRFVAVHAPQPIGLPEEIMLCTGGMVTLALPPSFTDVLWSNGYTWNSLTLTAPAELTVQATDSHGCSTGGEVRVVMDDCALVVPNVFTPNGDGTNDHWFPTGGFISAMVRIRNRWGGLVFEGDMVQRGWDGRHFLSGNYCSDGVYFYELTLTTSAGTALPLSGYLHLQGRRP